MSPERISVRHLNQSTSEVVRRLRKGESLVLTDRSVDLAVLLPVDGEVAHDELEMDLLSADAVAPSREPGELKLPGEESLIPWAPGVSVADMIEQERADR